MRTIATTSAFMAALVGTVNAQHPGSFAVLRFHGQGPLVEGCVDPIVNPGTRSSHAHTVMGASNFDTIVSGESLMSSKCTNAQIPGDNSAYWMPKLYFQDPKTSKIEDVKLFYANIYYFFGETDDDIVPFPPGLQMLSGDASTRVAPASGGDLVLDPEDSPDGKVQPAQWTCPRSSNSPTYRAGSDGSKAGIKDSRGDDRGTGFPIAKCDGLYSPLRADLHFPSCYNPEAGIEDWKNNMAYPSRKYQKNGNGKKNCPPGYLHVPHLFFEFYWDTQAFNDRWEEDGINQPFVLANGDRTGFSLHGDFVSGWDSKKLEWIIKNCNAGSAGMDKCFPELNVASLAECKIQSPIKDTVTGVMDELPCNNPIVGWGVGDAGNVGSSKPSVVSPAELKEPSSTVKSSIPIPDNKVNVVQSNEAKPEATASKPNSYEVPAPEVPEPETSTFVAETSLVTTPTQAAPSESEAERIITHWTTETIYLSTTIFVGSPAATAASVPDASGFRYAGCYRDSHARALSTSGPHGSMTNELCATACSEKGFSIAGLEYGGECYCGNFMEGSEVIDESECDMACDGNASQTCGGSWALSVYSKTGSVQVQKRHERKSRVHTHGHMHKRVGFSGRR